MSHTTDTTPVSNERCAGLSAAAHKTHCGKQQQWRDVDTMEAVMAIVNLPDVSINGSKQKKSDWHAQLKAEFDRLLSVLMAENLELNNWQRMDVWKARSGRNVADQGRKRHAACRKLRGAPRIVEANSMTGNIIDEAKMQCVVGLYNGAIKLSHFYDVCRNPNYSTGKPFNYPKTFH